MNKLFSSLRARLLLLVFIALAPALGIIIYSAAEQRRMAIDEVRKDVLDQSHLLAAGLQQFVEGARQLFTAISHHPAILSRDSAACNKFLSDVLKHNPQYANLGAADPQGSVFSSVVPLKKPVNAHDLPWFQRAVEGRGFSVGNYQVGGITGMHVIVFSNTALDEAERIKAVLLAPLDLSWLNKFISRNLPACAAVFVIDRSGTILARHPDHERWVGKTVPNAKIVKTILTQKRGVVEAEGVDGIKRIYSFAPVEGADNGIYASVGIPADIALAHVNRAHTRNLVLFGLIFALSFAAALIIGNLAKRSEEALREGGEYNRTLFESSPIGLVLCRMDGSLVDVNQAYANIIGKTVDETLKLTYWEITPEKYAEQEKIQLESLNTIGRYGPYEKEYIHKDGHLVPVRLQGLIIEKGGKKHIWSSVEDITERKKAEKALQEKEYLLSESQRIANIGSWICHPLTNTIVWSPENYNVFGVSPDTFVLTLESFFELIHPDNRAAMQTWIDACIAGEKPGNFEFRIIPPDGNIRIINGRGDLQYDANNSPFRMVGTSQDITERKRAEQELEKYREHLEKLVKERTAELETKIAEVERMNKLFVGRELRVIELKEKIKEMESKRQETSCKLQENDKKLDP